MPAVSFLLHLTGASQESAVLSFGKLGLGGPQLLEGIQSLPSKLSSKTGARYWPRLKPQRKQNNSQSVVRFYP